MKEDEQDSNFNLDKRTNRWQVQRLVDKIKEWPTKERNRIISYLEQGDDYLAISKFNDLLMALVMAEELDLAWKIFSRISSSYGLEPNSRTLSIIIWFYCKKKNLDEAERLMKYMMENRFRINSATLTIVIDAFCKRGRVQRAFDVLEDIGFGCKPIVQTYNCLLKGLCHVGRVEEAHEMLMKLNTTDIYSYTAVMDGFCKVGRSDEAMELLKEALEMRLTPDVVTFNTLFNGYCIEGRPLDGIAVLEMMKQTNCTPDSITYTTLLHGLLKWGKTEVALRVYNEMFGIGFQVDDKIMNTLVRGLCKRCWKKKQLFKDAHQLFEKMRNRQGCVIEPSTYDLMIQALCFARNADEAGFILQHMIGMGYSPLLITFNYVLRVLCVQRKVTKALLVLVLVCECEGGGMLSSRVSYNILIQELNRQGNILGASNVYGAALKRGVIPTRKPLPLVGASNRYIGGKVVLSSILL